MELKDIAAPTVTKCKFGSDKLGAACQARLKVHFNLNENQKVMMRPFSKTTRAGDGTVCFKSEFPKRSPVLCDEKGGTIARAVMYGRIMAPSDGKFYVGCQDINKPEASDVRMPCAPTRSPPVHPDASRT